MVEQNTFYSLMSAPWAIPVVFGCLVGIASIFARAFSECVQRTSLNRLKQSMVNRGYTAVDIERVVAANPDGLGKGSPVHVK